MAKPENRRKTGTGKNPAARGPDGKFAKGKSGNPGGRPRTPAEIRDMAREAGPRALERAAELIEHSDPVVALRASVVVMDRAFGRTAQPLIGSLDDPPVQTEDVTDAAVRLELARRLAFILYQADKGSSST